jgi:two-component system sensor histidine kinase RegB
MIRWIAVGGQAVTLSAIYFGLGFDLPIVLAMAVVMASGLLNVVLSMTRPASAWLGEREAALTLGYDVVQLSALLYLTGGLQNPFAILILAPVAVSAWTLSRRSTLALVLLATSIVSALAVWHLPLPGSAEGLLASPLYVAGIWTAIVIAIFFIASYVASIGEEARRMSEALAAARSALSREQQLSALGGLAAAAAHDLGSPLGTIAVVARELERELPDGSPWREDVELLLQESVRCGDILARLAERPDGDGGPPFNRLPFSALVEAAILPYRCPDRDIEFHCAASCDAREPPPTVKRDPEILQGLGVLVQNAVQFAEHRVAVDLGWNDREVELTISDDGPGFDLSDRGRLGEPYYSTGARDGREHRSGQRHMGLGIFIARTLLSHRGAVLRFDNRPGGGALVEVRWPRDRLQAAAGEGVAP